MVIAARLLAVFAIALAASACASLPSGPYGRSGGVRSIDLQPPPLRLPPAESAGAGALLGGSTWSARGGRVNWGAGYLEATGGTEPYSRIDIPLFDAPGGRHWGWYTQGRGYDLERRRAGPARHEALIALPGRGRAFIVTQTLNNGWIQFRWGAPDDIHSGLAWTRADLAGGRRAIFTPWAAHFRGVGGLVFRNSGSAHNVRSGPGQNHAVVARVDGAGYDMQALEIRGDWMRVRIVRPPACDVANAADDAGLLGGPSNGLAGGPVSSEQTGWVAWRSNDRGPWVAETRAGCRGGASS